MSRHVTHTSLARLAKLLIVAMAAILLLAARPAWAQVPYFPNVTEAMSEPSFWAQKLKEPNKVLATPDEVSELNQQILADRGSCMNDLKNWSQESYDGVEYAQALRQSGENDARDLYNVYWARYDKNKHYYATLDEMLRDFYAPIIDNCASDNATTQDMRLYGICTTRGYILCFPSDEPILDDGDDPDYDYRYQTALRVNEPVIINSVSKDDKYYHVISSCTQGWVDKREIAICASREQWLDAWDIPSDQVLVVYDDKIQTEESYYAPQISSVLLPMGTCLRLAAPDEWGNILADTNRSGHNNHVVWMPVRKEDGSYAKRLALIPEHCKVSEGYLPLTVNNIISVSLNYLGNAYGWGGGMGTEDCSGYIRDVYRCFGLDLPRNTTWQSAAPVLKYNLAGMTDAQKTEVIKSLPPGATLFFNGHEMTYLGCEDDKLFVISDISSIVFSKPAPGTDRIRCCTINTLTDIKRRSGNTWLTELDTATVPFFGVGHEAWVDGSKYQLVDGDGGSWKPEGGEGLSFTVKRTEQDEACFDHFTGISVDGAECDGAAYEAVRGSVVLTLKPSFLATLTAGSHNLVFHFDDDEGVAATFQVLEAQTYAIATEADGNGSVAVSQSAAIPGASITVTLTPDANNSSTGVTVTDGKGSTLDTMMVNANTYTFTMTASDVTVRGSFAPILPVAKRYDIAVEAAQNGTAYAQKSAEAGAVVTVTLTPQVGCASQGVSVRDANNTELTATSVNENTYTFVMPAQDVTVAASFTETDMPLAYAIALNQADHGSVSASVTAAAAGDVVTLTLVPERGHASKGIAVRSKTGAAVSSNKINENTYTFVMPAQDVEVSASFAKATSAKGGSSAGSDTTKGAVAQGMPKTGDTDRRGGAYSLLAGVVLCLAGVALHAGKRAQTEK